MWLTSLLRVLACATVALAPLEGYLLQVHGQLAKAVPAALIGVWVISLVRQRRLPAPHPLHLLLALLAVVLLATSAVHVAEPFTLEYLVRWVPFLVVTVVLADVAAREVPVRALLAACVAGAVVAAGGGLLSLIGGELRATGPLEDPNDLAFFLVGALPLLVALPALGPVSKSVFAIAGPEPAPGGTADRPTYNTGMRACRPHRQEPPQARLSSNETSIQALGRSRIVLLLLGAVLVAGIAATFSRGGGIALGCALVWLIVRRALPVRAVVVTAAVAGVAALVFAGVAQAELSRAFQEKSHIAGTNADTRMLRWQAAARMLSDAPVLGVGPGGFRQEYAAASHNAEIDEQTPVAHNLFLEVAAELGLPGFALLIGLIAIGFVASERALRVVADRRAAVAVQAALIAVLVASIFLSEQYYLPLWSLVAIAVAIEQRALGPVSKSMFAIQALRSSQKESGPCAFST